MGLARHMAKEVMREIGNKSREFYEFVLPPVDMHLENNNLVITVDIPGFNKEIFDALLTELGAEVDWVLPIETWEFAGKAQVDFLARRRKLGLQGDKRVLPDFLIGAHALARGAALMTFDENRYRTSFPKLELITK